ncbi:flagellar biosynthesis regulator FlaF [Desulfatitalea tepidiphila]|uniref:flagellar biosynthesis regulator FlaF n=1 Tax=Desulfatitalea tepidiphila TaxID=1185843 RepID=UPI0006B55CD2|nr:flagellar biosynthesis regulator FlaF [Desulfatitalea tepidiphila]
MLQNAVNSYQSVDKQSMSGRETEARVLTQGALKLVDCQKNWSAPDRNERLDAALRYNQRIWTFFQVEVSRPENPLPNDIKQNIIHLSRFIDQRIFDTMAFPESHKLNVLIRINQNIAAGLRGSASDI